MIDTCLGNFQCGVKNFLKGLGKISMRPRKALDKESSVEINRNEETDAEKFLSENRELYVSQ